MSLTVCACGDHDECQGKVECKRESVCVCKVGYGVRENIKVASVLSNVYVD